MNEHEMSQQFEIWRETVVRLRLPLTVILLKAAASSDDAVPAFLQAQVRKTDILFQLADADYWGVLLLQSSVVEAKSFITRIFSILKEKESNTIRLKAVITEIRNNSITFETLMNINKQQLADHEQPEWNVLYNDNYRNPPIETVKVSVIEQNDIFRQVLVSMLSQLNLSNFELDVAAYEDGFSFLEGNAYKSGHIHLIIMNDIMTRKNGIEILHALRKMPNSKKFVIYMMSERNSEGAMLNAYEGGVDEYLVKPFNLRLLEAKIRRTFARYWL